MPIKILLVRLSSMGDIIHNFPAVSDLVAHYPDAAIDWLVEESFAPLAALHPAIRAVIPVALRRWRKSLLHGDTRREVAALYRRLRHADYDLVIDSQCLVKSALLARLVNAPCAGMDWRGAREPLASLLYHRRFAIPWRLHAVRRYRLLTGRTLGYEARNPVHYGIVVPTLLQPWRPGMPYAVLLTATSRDDKLWPEDHWQALGLRLQERGLQLVLPWGSTREQARAERIASQLPGAMVAPRLSLIEAARLLADAQIAIGVDTGLAHLAAAVQTPTVAIYVSTDPEATGVLAACNAVNLGGIGQLPAVETVATTVERLLTSGVPA